MVEVTPEFAENLAKAAAPFMEQKKPPKPKAAPQSYVIKENIKIARDDLEGFRETRNKLSTGEVDAITETMLESGGKELNSEEIEALANKLTNEYYENWAGGPITKEEMDQIKKIAVSSYHFFRDVEPHLKEIVGTPAYNELMKTDADVPWNQREAASIEATIDLNERMGKKIATPPSEVEEFDQTNAAEVATYLQLIDPQKYGPTFLKSTQGKLIIEDRVRSLNDKTNNLMDFWRINILALRQPVQA